MSLHSVNQSAMPSIRPQDWINWALLLVNSCRTWKSKSREVFIFLILFNWGTSNTPLKDGETSGPPTLSSSQVGNILSLCLFRTLGLLLFLSAHTWGPGWPFSLWSLVWCIVSYGHPVRLPTWANGKPLRIFHLESVFYVLLKTWKFSFRWKGSNEVCRERSLERQARPEATLHFRNFFFGEFSASLLRWFTDWISSTQLSWIICFELIWRPEVGFPSHVWGIWGFNPARQLWDPKEGYPLTLPTWDPKEGYPGGPVPLPGLGAPRWCHFH